MLLQSLAAVKRNADSEYEIAAQSNEHQVENSRQALDEIIAIRSKYADVLKKESSDRENASQAAIKQAGTLRGKLSDTQFDTGIHGRDTLTRSFLERNRAGDLADQAAKRLNTGSSKDDKEAADQTFDRAESYAKLAVSSAQASKNITAQVQAERLLESILAQRIKSEETFGANAKASSQQLARQAQSEQDRTDKLKDLKKDFLDLTSGVNKKGDVLDSSEVAKNLQKAKPIYEQIQNLAFGKGSKFTNADIEGVKELQDRLKSPESQAKINKLNLAPQAISDLQTAIQGSLKDREFLIKIALDPSALKGLSVGEAKRVVEKQILDASKKGTETSGISGASSLASANVGIARRRANDSFNAPATGSEKLQSGFGHLALSLPALLGTLDSGLDVIAKQRKVVNQQVNNPNVKPDEILRSNKLFQATRSAAGGNDVLAPTLNRLATEIEALNQIQLSRAKQAATAAKPSNAGEVLENLNSRASNPEVIQRAAQPGGNAEVEGAAQAAENETSALERGADAAGRIASNMISAASAAQQAALASQGIKAGSAGQSGPVDLSEHVAAALGGQVSAYARGGYVRHLHPRNVIASRFLATGGPSGTDTIPAMLSPDEFVINSTQSRRFNSQLQSINAGVTPNFNHNVTHTVNIGDINVNGAGNPKATAAEVVNQIRRSQRRAPRIP